MKRFFDFTISLLGLLITSPFLLIISTIIVIDSKGDVFFRQIRVGRNNQDFYIYKFRTMYMNSDELGLLTVGKRDPRVTRFGYYLRKYKLDEFPQLINVLIGEMSFVGPRPEVRKYVDLYTPEQMKILDVRPGITDYASIEYSNENEILAKSQFPEKTYIENIMPEKLKLNQKYISDSSLLTDIKLIFSTIIKIGLRK